MPEDVVLRVAIKAALLKHGIEPVAAELLGHEWVVVPMEHEQGTHALGNVVEHVGLICPLAYGRGVAANEHPAMRLLNAVSAKCGAVVAFCLGVHEGWKVNGTKHVTARLDVVGITPELVGHAKARVHGRTCEEVPSRRAAKDSDARRIDLEALGVGAQEANGCLDVPYLRWKLCLRTAALVHGCDYVTRARTQASPRL